MRETVAGRPFVLILDAKGAFGKVTCHHYRIEHLHKVFYPHYEDAILYIPSVYVSLVVCVPVQHVHTVELLSNLLSPRSSIAIIKWPIPFLRVSPRIFNSNKPMHLTRIPLLSPLSSNLPHVQYRVVESWLETLSQSKSVEVVLSIFFHLIEHLKIELAAQHTMIVTKNPQTVEETCLVSALKRIDEKGLWV